MMYLIIFLAKIVEVSLGTLRMVLITKGERLVGSIIGFVEVTMWIIIVGKVLTDISSDPLRVLAYAGGFSAGNYLGSWIEEKLGIGTAEVQTIVLKEDGKKLANFVRDAGFAVTVVEGEGKSYTRNILFMYVRRKRVKELIDVIQRHQDNAVITVSEAKPIYGGFNMRRK
jgi:uncharacterized protein YebE (UPF0316 family)